MNKNCGPAVDFLFFGRQVTAGDLADITLKAQKVRLPKMNISKQSQAEDIPENPEAIREEINRLLGDISVRLLGDPQRQQTALSIAETVMATWSAGNPLKKLISYFALKSLPMLPADDAQNDRAVNIAADLGRLMVLRWTLQARENQADPSAAGEKTATFIQTFLENTDVSAWKTMLEASRASKIDSVRRLNEVLTEYQGKLLVVLAALPTIINIAANSARSYLEAQLKVLPPEMVFEIFNGLNEQIAWKDVGRMINDHFEMSRRIHIGSLLAGDGSKSALQNLAADALKEIVSEIEPERYAEARTARAGNKEALKNAVSDMMHACPNFAKKMLAAAALSQNAAIRGMKNRLQVMADMPDDDRDDAVEQFADAFDEQELADLASLMVQTANIIYAGNPERIPQAVSTLAACVDDGELMELAQSGLIRDLFRAIKPLAVILMPAIIDGIGDLLTPEPDEDNEDLQAALTRLSGIMGDLNANQ